MCWAAGLGSPGRHAPRRDRPSRVHAQARSCVRGLQRRVRRHVVFRQRRDGCAVQPQPRRTRGLRPSFPDWRGVGVSSAEPSACATPRKRRSRFGSAKVADAAAPR
jgi:hypothetical protein